MLSQNLQDALNEQIKNCQAQSDRDWRISRRNEINQMGRIVWMRMAEELTFVPDMDKEFHGAP